MITSPGTPQRSQRAALDRTLLGGVAWSGMARAATQLVSWVVTFRVAHILVPSDYGLLASAALFIGVIRMMTELSLSTIIVTLRDLDQEQVAQLGGLAVLLGVCGGAAIVALASPISGFLHAPLLVKVMPVLAISLVVSTFASVPMALLQKRLAFKRLSTVEVIRNVVGSLSLLAFATLGLGYWSLVFNELLATTVGVAALTYSAPFRLAWPRYERLRHSMTMSMEMLVGRLAWYGYNNADFFVAARRLGSGSLGEYTMAWTLISMPTDKVTSLVQAVVPSVFARVQQDREALSRYLILLTEGLALLLFPACIGIALVADDLVRFVLGEKWAAAVPVLRALAVFGALRCVMPLVSQVMVARKMTRIGMWLSIFTLVLLPPCFWFGSRWGIAGIAWTWMVVYPFLAALQYAIVLRDLQLSVWRALAAFWPATVGCIIMSVVVWAAQWGLTTAHISGITRLATECLAGAIVYCAFAWVVRGHRLRSVIAMIRTPV